MLHFAGIGTKKLGFNCDLKASNANANTNLDGYRLDCTVWCQVNDAMQDTAQVALIGGYLLISTRLDRIRNNLIQVTRSQKQDKVSRF
jgi:hypothetical protein